jgi:hypothetical protein
MKTISISNQINFWRNARKEAIERNAPLKQSPATDSITKLDQLIKELKSSNREQKFKK